MKDLKPSAFARLAEVRARAIAQVEEAKKMLEANPPPSLAELVEVTTARFKAALGPDTPLPPSLSSLRNREAVERLSLEGKPVGEIARLPSAAASRSGCGAAYDPAAVGAGLVQTDA